MKGRSSIVIAHRLSTVRRLDRILVFDRGELVEEGTDAALIARAGGIYRGLFERQVMELDTASAAKYSRVTVFSGSATQLRGWLCDQLRPDRGRPTYT